MTAYNKVEYNGNTLIDLTGVTATAGDVASGKVIVGADGQTIIGTASGGGGAPILGVLRPDAELVQRWTYDKMLVADEEISIPAYSTSSQTLKASENLATYDGTPSTYRYLIVERALTIPEYSIATLAKGRQEYVFSAGVYEWVYNPANQFQTIDGTKKYGQYSQMLSNGTVNRELYWSSASAVALYTSNVYCLNQTLTAPTISSNKTITIKSPSIAIRGHATYLAETFFEAITDARLQYVIELYRIPIEQGIINGGVLTSLGDSVLGNIANGGTLT